jgi:chromate reductase, NAD(P)H dehydrogenase (quinone)
MADCCAMIKVLGISGSLRAGSFNTALLRTAKEMAGAEMAIDIADIRDIPLYDEDVRAKGLPPSVQRFREQVAAADAILFVTPEYNYSVPGVLKNAIDWASRPPAQPFADKPIAIMGASGGLGGTLRAQYHLRQIMVFLDAHVLNKPEVFVRSAQDAFDAELQLKDERTRKVVGELLQALATWTKRLARQP